MMEIKPTNGITVDLLLPVRINKDNSLFHSFVILLSHARYFCELCK